MKCRFKGYVVDITESLKKQYGDVSIKEMISKAGKDIKIDYLTHTTTEKGQQEIADLFSSDEKKVAASQSSIKDSIINVNSDGSPRKDVLNKLTRLLNQQSNDISLLNEMLGDEFAKLTPSEVIDASVALKYILDAINTEPILAANYELTEENIGLLTNEGPSVGTARLYPTIGRAILAARGHMTIGDPIFNAAQATKVAMPVIAKLADIGVITIGKGIWNSGGVQYKKGVVSKDNMASGEVIKFPTNSKFINKLDNSIISEKGTAVFGLLKELSRVIEPYTESVPSTVAKKYDESIQDLQNVHPNFKSIIDTVNSFKFKLNPAVASILKSLHTAYMDKVKNSKYPISVRNFLKEEFDTGKKGEVNPLKEIFGIDTSVNEDNEIFGDSRRGVEQSRMAPLVGLLENFEALNIDKDGTFHFNYFTAVNSRAFILETILNFQSDKKFARQALIGGKATTYTNNKSIGSNEYNNLTEKEVLIKRVAKEFGLSEEEITGNYSSMAPNTVLENTLATFNKEGSDNLVYNKSLLNTLVTFGNAYKIKSDVLTNEVNPWRVLKLLNVIKDIRSEDSNGNITSNYMAEVDATASGLLIMLLQNAHNPKVQELIKRLGFKKAGEEIENQLNDAYGIALEVLADDMSKITNEELARMSIPGNISSIDPNTLKTKQLLDVLDISVRDLIKMPIITFIYGQSSKNNQQQFATEAVDMILQKGTDTINKALEIYLPNREPLTTLFSKLNSKEATALKKELAAAIAKTSGKYLVDGILNKVYTKDLFSETNNDIIELYEEIEKQGAVVQSLNPFSKLQAIEDGTTDAKKYINDRILLNKKKETLFDGVNIDGKQIDMIANIRSSNPTSAKVVPIHSIDAATLMRTIQRYIKEMAAAGTPLTEDEAMMLVHDAIYTNSIAATRLSQIYEEELIYTNMNFDVIESIIEAYEHDGFKLTPKIQEIKNRNEKNIQNKKAFLESVPEGNRYMNYSFKTNLDTSKIQSYDIRTQPKRAGENRDLTVKPSSTAIVLNTFNKQLMDNAKVVYDIVASNKPYVVYDIETYLTKGKPDSNTAIPNEIYAERFNSITGEKEVFHQVYINEELGNIHDQLNSDNRFNSFTELQKLEANDSLDTLINNFKEWLGNDPIFTFNGNNFDDKIINRLSDNTTAPINSIDVRDVLLSLKTDNSKTGTLEEFAKALDVDTSKGTHTGDKDVTILNSVVNKISNLYSNAITANRVQQSIDNIAKNRTKLSAEATTTAINVAANTIC